MKMRFPGVCMPLIAICLVSLTVDSIGELVMIHRLPESTDRISLTCESEDDHAALIWNHDLEEPLSTKKNFSKVWPPSNPNCAIVAPDGCVVKWNKSTTWAVVESIDYPMGPVFDSRWEDFEEHSYSLNNCSYEKNITKSSSIVFSVRGLDDIFIVLCPQNKTSVHSIFRSTSADHLHWMSGIHSCIWKDVLFLMWLRFGERSFEQFDWRTYILRWDINRGIISVQNSEFRENLTFQTSGKNVNLMFDGNDYQGRVKFHFYKYFLATEKNAKLTTLEFHQKEQSFCIELLVSLCTGCTLNVSIVDRNDSYQTIGSISGAEYQSMYSELPAWRLVKLSTNLSKNYENPIRLGILTDTSENSIQGRWAIDSFRKCVSVDTVRSVSSIESPSTNIQCQKLSYTENSVVKSNASAVRRILEKLKMAGFEVGPPGVRNITATTALLYYPKHLNESMWHKLHYKIKTENSSWISITKNTTKSQNPEYNETLIDNLSPKTLYTVRVVIRVNDTNEETFHLIEIESVGHNFSTIQEAHSIVASPYTTIHETVEKHGWKLNLIWIIILPTIATYVLLLSVVQWRRKTVYARMMSVLSVSYTNDPPLSEIDWQFDYNWDDFAHFVELKKFDDYVKRALENGELESQFKMLPRGMIRPCESGKLPINKSKNRCSNLIAYDETRVILGEGSLRSDSNYINANYIQGYYKEKAYIATQSPDSETVVDFWRMIWQEEVFVICMLANVIEGGKIICEQYWPEIGKTVEYGHISILNLDQRAYAHYTYRTFQLTTRFETTSRKIRHLQYTGWPEQGVPMYSHSMIEYLNELFATPPGPGPIVVHCATGAGRTGTVILCDISLRHASANEMVDLFSEAQKMYDARANMLDSLQQYVLAHLVPTQCLLLPSTKLLCSDVSLERIEELKANLPAHMQRLAVFYWKDKALDDLEPWQRLSNPEDIAKTRFPNLMPVGRNLVTLKQYPPHKKNSDFICAVSVDGVRTKAQYIASQLPLPSTFSDCWRLVAEKKIELIIILQCPGPEDPSCIEVIPCKTSPLIPVPHLKVEYKLSFNHSEHFTMDELLLTDSSEEQAEVQHVTVLTCSSWSVADNAEPPPAEKLVALWSASRSVSRAEGPTLVLCRDGITGCGLYLALSFLLEKMAVEQECDVFSAVRAIRQSRPEFVNSKEQFEYLYDAAVIYLEGFETYANFSSYL